jgi:hypothetical protein
VIRIFDALLRLAEIDAGMRRSGFVPLDVRIWPRTPWNSTRPRRSSRTSTLISNPTADCRYPATRAARPGAEQPDRQCTQIRPRTAAIGVAVHKRATAAAEISVSDNGPGIRIEEKGKVVERFYRGDASRGTPGVGWASVWSKPWPS